MHSKTLALMTIACLTLAGPATAAITPPVAGTQLAYTCTGPYSASVRVRVTEVNGSSIRTDGKADERTIWTEKPLWAIPTSFATRRSRGDASGVREAKIKKGSLEGIAALQPGSSFKAQVRVAHDKGSPVWQYEVTIGDRQTTNDTVVGTVEVVEVRESRSTGSYSSRMTTRLAPALGINLGWTYKDRKGEQSCSLTSRS